MNHASRFWSKVDLRGEDDCWKWMSSDDGFAGYGRFWLDGSARVAHRVAYELAVGPIPPGMQIDHLCRNRACVNPRHLEPVTGLENRRRAVPFQTPVTECRNGHPYDAENTYVTPDGRRDCKVCRRASKLRYYYKTRAARGVA